MQSNRIDQAPDTAHLRCSSLLQLVDLDFQKGPSHRRSTLPEIGTEGRLRSYGSRRLACGQVPNLNIRCGVILMAFPEITTTSRYFKLGAMPWRNTYASIGVCRARRRGLRSWQFVGGGPVFRKAGRTSLYDPVDLDAWAQARIGQLRKSTSVLV